MKIILSRKGFDGESGGVPSPIFPDGTFCSLPIPSNEKGNPSLDQIIFNEMTLGSISSDLRAERGYGKTKVHLDPDLNKSALKRERGWCPCFGQASAALSHLEHHAVSKGDIFLFFGWFKEVVNLNGRLAYRQGAPDIHCIFGWLQIETAQPVNAATWNPPKWAKRHPHVQRRNTSCEPGGDTLYIAPERLKIPSFRRKIPGGGIFTFFKPSLRLTAASAENRSTWSLPAWFYPFSPDGERPPLSYHRNRRIWKTNRDGVLLHTVSRGQEFVLDCDYYPEAIDWIKSLF